MNFKLIWSIHKSLILPLFNTPGCILGICSIARAYAGSFLCWNTPFHFLRLLKTRWISGIRRFATSIFANCNFRCQHTYSMKWLAGWRYLSRMCCTAFQENRSIFCDSQMHNFVTAKRLETPQKAPLKNLRYNWITWTCASYCEIWHYFGPGSVLKPIRDSLCQFGHQAYFVY